MFSRKAHMPKPNIFIALSLIFSRLMHQAITPRLRGCK
jgi:hypothetical protein